MSDARKIPDEQWELPFSLSADGKRHLTLREILEAGKHALSLAQLSPSQRAELTARRIARQPRFELAMVGAGVVSKEQAIAAVKAQSRVGLLLMEIEQRVMQGILEDARSRVVRATGGPKVRSRRAAAMRARVSRQHARLKHKKRQSGKRAVSKRAARA